MRKWCEAAAARLSAALFGGGRWHQLGEVGPAQRSCHEPPHEVVAYPVGVIDGVVEAGHRGSGGRGGAEVGDGGLHGGVVGVGRRPCERYDAGNERFDAVGGVDAVGERGRCRGGGVPTADGVGDRRRDIARAPRRERVAGTAQCSGATVQRRGDRWPRPVDGTSAAVEIGLDGHRHEEPDDQDQREHHEQQPTYPPQHPATVPARRTRNALGTMVVMVRAARRAGFACFALALVACLGAAGCVAGSETSAHYDAVVTRGVDGDTIVVRYGDGRTDKVRILGVDTPETHKPGTPVQCYGPEASSYTEHALVGHAVRLELDQVARDKYGRLLAYVYVDGRRFDDELLRLGYARLLIIRPNGVYARAMLSAELAAKQAKRGLWGAC